MKERVVRALQLQMLEKICPEEFSPGTGTICANCEFANTPCCSETMHKEAAKQATIAYLSLGDIHNGKNCNKYIVNPEVTDKDLYLCITKVLRKLGCPAHLSGYDYAREAIALAVKDHRKLQFVMKSIYTEVGKQYGKDPSQVERAIRHLIEVCVDRGDYEVLQGMFSNSISYKKGKPVSSEFIARVSEQVRLELNFPEED